MVHVPCRASFKLEDAPRIQPWYTREPTEEEKGEMDRLEAIAKGEESKFVTAGDGTDLGTLMQHADTSLETMDFSGKEAILASVKSMFELLQDSKVVKDLLPKDDSGKELQETVQRILLADKEETSPGQHAKRVVTELQKAAKKAKISAAGGRVYLNCPFEEKDEAKALGAKWDWRQKKWYVTGEGDITKFAKWIKAEGHESDPSSAGPGKTAGSPSAAATSGRTAANGSPKTFATGSPSASQVTTTGSPSVAATSSPTTDDGPAAATGSPTTPAAGYLSSASKCIE